MASAVAITASGTTGHSLPVAIMAYSEASGNFASAIQSTAAVPVTNLNLKASRPLPIGPGNVTWAAVADGQ